MENLLTPTMVPAVNSTAFDAAGYLTQGLPGLLSQVTAGLGERLVLQVLVPGQVSLRTHYVLGGDGVEVKPGFAASPDVTLTLQLPELEQLARGSLALQEALLLGRVRLFGNAEKARLLAARLRA